MAYTVPVAGTGSYVGTGLSAMDLLLSGGLRLLERLDPGPLYLGERLPAAATHAQRDPVILVSGFANSPHSWRRYAASLQRDGFQVFIVDLPGRGLTDMQAASADLHKAIATVRRSTGAARVDLVGFSEGGVLSRMLGAYAAGQVDSIVTLATPHRGVDGWVRLLSRVLPHLPLLGPLVPTSLGQLTAGSDLLAAVPPGVPGARLTSVYAGVTDGVVGAASARVHSGSNVELAPSLVNSHYGMLHWSGAAYEAVRGALLR